MIHSRAYAGIGSRTTPPEIREAMSSIAARLARLGWTLRTGGAEGADAAFLEGALAVGGRVELYLPWEGFNGHVASLFAGRHPGCSALLAPSPQAALIAAEHHPAWPRLSPAARALQARNTHQIYGLDPTTPSLSQFVLCWTPSAKGTGGTGQALRLAAANSISIFDLAEPTVEQRLRRWLGQPATVSTRDVFG